MAEKKGRDSTSPLSSSTSPSVTPFSINFFDFSTGEDMICAIRRAAEDGNLPVKICQGMEELYHNYRNAVYQSGNPNASEIVLSNTAAAFRLILRDIKAPFVFSPYHKAIREPFDYYLFGQKYIRPLIDFKNSYIGNAYIFHEIEVKLKKGENIVLMSNHQAEGDPAIIALMLESANRYLSETMIYVAGDRVITDPLSKPFSMGRNLICVYSKKHMNDDPDLIGMKKAANVKSLKEMASLLKDGSKIIWIAPSGGRDRPDPVTHEFYPSEFEVSSVDNMRRLVETSGVAGHIYPLALLCYDIMPPPPQVEKDIGEKRILSYHGVGLSVGPKISFQQTAATSKDHQLARDAYAQALYDCVKKQYNVLKSAIYGKQGLEASTPNVMLSQPFS